MTALDVGTAIVDLVMRAWKNHRIRRENRRIEYNFNVDSWAIGENLDQWGNEIELSKDGKVSLTWRDKP